MTKTVKAAMAALMLGTAAMAAGEASAQPHGGGHAGAVRGGSAHGAYRGYGGGYRGGFGGYRGGWGWGAPWYGYYGAAPWAWYGAPYAYDYYDDYDDYTPPQPYYPAPPPAAQPAPPPVADAPPPPEPPAARPARTTKEFILYFPFDSDQLSTDAQRIVRDAAHYDRERPGARATIVGYTDASGTEGYNNGLSERRSQAVREALRAEGVEDGTIDMAWRGKHDLAVRTPDGVREPANRRVTIVVSEGPGEDSKGAGDDGA